jgi:hypothetical protein
MGQRTLEESFASWHTCIGDPAFLFLPADERPEYAANVTLRQATLRFVLLLRLSRGDHDDLGDVAGRPGRPGKKSLPSELRRPCPARQPEEIKRVSGGGIVAALFPRMVISEFAQDDGSHGSAFGGRVQLPIETEALSAGATANVLPELRPSE